jgi:hypothetical protein
MSLFIEPLLSLLGRALWVGPNVEKNMVMMGQTLKGKLVGMCMLSLET